MESPRTASTVLLLLLLLPDYCSSFLFMFALWCVRAPSVPLSLPLSLGFKRSSSSSISAYGRMTTVATSLLRNGFEVEERPMRLALGHCSVLRRSSPPSKAVSSCVREGAGLQHGGAQQRAGGRAGRPPIRQRKSSWKIPWETGEREKSAIVHTWPEPRGEGRERMDALIVIRVRRRAKRTNFMSYCRIAPSAMITYQYSHRRSARLGNQSGEITTESGGG